MGILSDIAVVTDDSRTFSLVPALTPRRLAGRSKVQATSKSAQFWHRPSWSSPRLHLMLRRLQKSPKRGGGCQFHILPFIRVKQGKWRTRRGNAGDGNAYRPLRRAGAFVVFATFNMIDHATRGTRDRARILAARRRLGCRFWGRGKRGRVHLQ